MSKYFFVLILAILLIPACANPNLGPAFQQACQNAANNRAQRYQYLSNQYQLRQPTYNYGIIYTPTGQAYQFNSTSY